MKLKTIPQTSGLTAPVQYVPTPVNTITQIILIWPKPHSVLPPPSLEFLSRYRRLPGRSVRLPGRFCRLSGPPALYQSPLSSYPSDWGLPPDRRPHHPATGGSATGSSGLPDAAYTWPISPYNCVSLHCVTSPGSSNTSDGVTVGDSVTTTGPSCTSPSANQGIAPLWPSLPEGPAAFRAFISSAWRMPIYSPWAR